MKTAIFLQEDFNYFPMASNSELSLKTCSWWECLCQPENSAVRKKPYWDGFCEYLEFIQQGPAPLLGLKETSCFRQGNKTA